MGNSVGNKATHGVLLERTAHPGVYRRGGQYVAVYRREGRQRKESAATFAEARAIKLARDAEANEQRRGPTLHDYALRWVARHAGSGHDSVREQTREEYRRLLATFALSYFPADLRLGDLDRRALQGFIGWLTDRPGRRGRLSDRSIRNALTPLRRLVLDDKALAPPGRSGRVPMLMRRTPQCRRCGSVRIELEPGARGAGGGGCRRPRWLGR
jgi:hypothetical protein